MKTYGYDPVSGMYIVGEETERGTIEKIEVYVDTEEEAKELVYLSK